MALNQTQVSQLYVTLFGRASEGSGNKYWQTQSDMAVAAQMMLDTAAAKTYFGTSMDDNQKFIEHIYKNTLNKTVAEDAAGIKFWVDALNAGNSRGFVASELLKAAVDPKNAGQAQDLFNNKVAISDYTAGKVQNVASASATDLKPFVDALNMVTHDPATVAAAKTFVDSIPEPAIDTSSDWVSTPVTPGETFTLTNSTDKATANVFEAPMTYNPGGTDRILSLQDEDVLTGTAGRTDNTLNATLGMQNKDETTGDARTPNLKNIQYLNAKITGDVNNLDLRYADGLTKVNVDQITLNAQNDIKVLNIKSSLEGMRVANAAKQDADVKFEFKEGVLAGTKDKSLLELNDVVAANVSIESDAASKEGYETLDLVAKNGVNINALKVNQMKELLIKGSGNLTIADLKSNTGTSLDEFTELDAGGIEAPGSTGLTKLDASGFKGKLTIDISEVINPATNPFSSGVDIPVDIIGSGVNDVFYSKKDPGKNAKLNGGEGNDKFVLISANVPAPKPGEALSITNVETLELRMQDKAAAVAPLWVKGTQAVNFDAFKDDALKTVVVRDESQTVGVAQFDLNNVTNTFAKEGKVVVEHSVTTGNVNADTGARTTGNVNKDVYLNILLKDASAKDDVVTIEVTNANNTQKQFNYEINADDFKKADKQAVENITVVDNDTEDNKVNFKPTHKVPTDKGIVDESDHTGTVTLKGGKAGNSYTVESVVFAKTLDASAQVSDLRLSVQDQFNDVGQDIKLGSGNDILTFEQVDGFDAKDIITDAGGKDVVRAAFSKDSVLNLTGIEELHVVAKENVKLDIAKADVEKVVIMSDKAVDRTNVPPVVDNSKLTPEPFKITGVEAVDIITFKNSSLKELNFFGDLDTDDSTKTDDDSKTQVFNGVTLADNKAEDLAININSSLDTVIKGADSYTVGQITVHGSKNITINMGDEKADDPATDAIEKTSTTIQNIYGKTINKIVANSKGDLNLGIVTADDQNRGVSLVDAMNVLRDFKASVIALGNNAEVKLADGDNVFSAYGSAGDNIKITAGNGNNTITGSAQSDDIVAGNGNNTVHGDRGNNNITVGNGDDVVTAKDGNDTIVFGEGYDQFTDNEATELDATKARTSVTKEFGAAIVKLDVDGSKPALGKATKFEVDQWIAVGKGSSLKVQWEGETLKTGINGTVLDGKESLLNDLTKADANSNLWTFDAVGTQEVIANDGNDVAIIVKDFAGANGVALTFKGGLGNDAAVGGDKSDYFEGGAGSDVLVMQKSIWYDHNGNSKIDPGEQYDNRQDTVRIADGDSVVGSHDVIYSFDAKSVAAAAVAATEGNHLAAALTTGRDTLDLDKGFSKAYTKNVDGTTNAVNGKDVGIFVGHAASDNNFISFLTLTDSTKASTFIGNTGEDYKTGTDGIAVATANVTKQDFVAHDNLGDALSYLAQHFNNSLQTAVFKYDRDGDGAYVAEKDSVFVFQDGMKDTVVELVGIEYKGVEAAGNATADMISIV